MSSGHPDTHRDQDVRRWQAMGEEHLVKQCKPVREGSDYPDKVTTTLTMFREITINNSRHQIAIFR